jgi:GTP-binding protein
VHTGIDEAMELVAEAARWRATRVPRGRLNELFQRAQLLRPLPMVRAKAAAQAGRLRVLYVQQARTEAPTFVFHLNRHSELHPSDERWLVNTIRSQWAFTGTPIRVVIRVRDQRRKRRERDKGRRRVASRIV